jgi:putative DNA primase/helicase
MRALAHVFGDYFITPDKSLIVTQRHEKHDTERAALFRTRLAVAVETDKRQKLNEAQIKNLTGGDRIHARRLYEDPWEFSPSHSMWLQTNYLPEIQGRDGGIWRRIRVVPWVVTFDADRQDTDLDEKLEDEAAGILNWLIAGCLDWQVDGLSEPDDVITATAIYRAAQDFFERFAQANGLMFRKDLKVAAKELGDLIAEWSQDEGLTRVPSMGDRAEWLKSHGASSGRETWAGRKMTMWYGVGFDPIDADPDDDADDDGTTDQLDADGENTADQPDIGDTPVQEPPTSHLQVKLCGPDCPLCPPPA